MSFLFYFLLFQIISNLLSFKLLKLGVCILASSEETTEEVELGANQGYSVSFDPLDGSSIVDANFAVGTICGIWPNRGLLNRTGREQVASLIAQYGPRITVILAFNSNATKSGQSICIELTMLPFSWIITKHHITIQTKCKTFAPGNLRATSDNLQYKELINYWIESKYTLRYSGGLVPDIYHILTKGEGIFTNASSKSSKAKLRLLYECVAIGLIVEAANGDSCVAPCEKGEEQLPISILDVPITYLDKRVGLCVGSKEEVERFKSYIFG